MVRTGIYLEDIVEYIGTWDRYGLPEIGDTVRVKSKDWYESEKNGIGYIHIVNHARRSIDFLSEMSKYCGKLLTVEGITGDGNLYVRESKFIFPVECMEGYSEETFRK